MLHRVQVTDTSQHQLFRGDSESGLHGQIAAKKPLLKDTNNKKRLAWHQEKLVMDMRPVENCPLWFPPCSIEEEV